MLFYSKASFYDWFAFSDCEIEIHLCRRVPRQSARTGCILAAKKSEDPLITEKKKSNYQEGLAAPDTQRSPSRSSDSQLP